ncbi:MAG: GNAT family N-acetyltransferase [Fimbriimonadaceae bacterium]|nr:GNAT family N-acetyltransferase [Fimbriimonadaceae bacterium]
MKDVRVEIADLSKTEHQQAVRGLTNAYAKDSNALGRSLPDDVLERLPDEIASHPAGVVFLAWSGDKPVGQATCFIGFATFSAKRLINVHDLIVLAECRGQGVGEKLLQAVEDYARANGFAKVTLEVAEGNPAKRLYLRCGFEEAGTFCAKYLVQNPWE